MKKLLLAITAIFFGILTIHAQEIDTTQVAESLTTITSPVEAVQDLDNNLKTTENTANDIVPRQGFSMNSLLRGVLGMFVLLLLAFLLSSNRKAINWRTVGFGLLAQLILAIGVLKVPFVQAIFEWVGGLFIAILNFTEAGTKFLFASFGTGEIESPLLTFAISILPTIIFFSALTSVLFYLGIIQKVATWKK